MVTYYSPILKNQQIIQDRKNIWRSLVQALVQSRVSFGLRLIFLGPYQDTNVHIENISKAGCCDSAQRTVPMTGTSMWQTDALTAPDSSWAVSLEPQPGRHLGKMCWREGDQSWSPRVLRVMWAVSITSHSAGSSQLMTRDVAVQKWEQLDLLLSLKFKSISMCSGCSVVSYLQFSKASSG